MRHPLIRLWTCASALLAGGAGAAEPCVPDDAVVDAVRHGDVRALEALDGDAGACGASGLESGDGRFVPIDVVHQLRAMLPVRRVCLGCIPGLVVDAAVAPSWQAVSRLDAGRSIVVRTPWSVGLTLTFTPRRQSLVFDAGVPLSRADARQSASQWTPPSSPGDQASAGRHVDALGRWWGAQLDHVREEARRRPRESAADLRSRVLRALADDQDAALLAGWLPSAASP